MPFVLPDVSLTGFPLKRVASPVLRHSHELSVELEVAHQKHSGKRNKQCGLMHQMRNNLRKSPLKSD